jgi:arylsulfatase A-like enzyme
MKNIFDSGKKRSGKIIILATATLLSCIGKVQTGKQIEAMTPVDKPNILFISVDDLRPQLGCYGNPQMKTPNIDALASEGIVFTSTYCQVPTCGASRASLLTGIRPKRNRFSLTRASAQRETPFAITLPEHLKNNGYCTMSGGKIFHSNKDSFHAWSENPIIPEKNGDHWRDYALEENRTMLQEQNTGPAYESPDAPDEIYSDGRLTQWALLKLQESADRDQPFFLGVGYVKPHLPFQAPIKYWDLYSEEDIKLAPNPFPPENAPIESIHNWKETRYYSTVPDTGSMPDEEALKMIHGYYASTSFVDSQVGKLLSELKRLGLEKNTIVVLWGDHGFQLGEHGLWDKHTNYRHSLHSPLIYRIPWMEGGKKAAGLNEFIDIYPTLCELTGISRPASLQGMSLVPLLKNPDLPGKTAVFSRYQEGNPLHGHTVRTEQYSYTEYSDADRKVVARMLYDIRKDPAENVNLSEREDYREVIERLSNMLKMIEDQS